MDSQSLSPSDDLTTQRLEDEKAPDIDPSLEPKVTIEEIEPAETSISESSSGDLEVARRRARARGKRSRRRKRWRICAASQAFMVTLTVVALLIAAIGLWPSISSQSDSKQSIALAQWEAEKDFLEFCENVCLFPLFPSPPNASKPSKLTCWQACMEHHCLKASKKRDAFAATGVLGQ